MGWVVKKCLIEPCFIINLYQIIELHFIHITAVNQGLRASRSTPGCFICALKAQNPN
jgi:hypothetical protein